MGEHTGVRVQVLELVFNWGNDLECLIGVLEAVIGSCNEGLNTPNLIPGPGNNNVRQTFTA